MTTEHGAAERHMAAAFHHEQAMRHHRDIARDSMIQKSRSYPMQQESLARAHALHAIDDGNSANRYYAMYDRHGLPNFPCITPDLAAKPAETIWIVRSGGEDAEHHIAAARHHAQAARYHRKASRHCVDGDYTLAIHNAKIAHRLARHAISQADTGTGRFETWRGPSGAQNKTIRTAKGISGFGTMLTSSIMPKMRRELALTVMAPQS